MHMIRNSPSETLFLEREAERESLLSCGCFPVKTIPFPLPLAWREVDGEGRSRAWLLIRLRSTTSSDLEPAVPLSLYMISKVPLCLPDFSRFLIQVHLHRRFMPVRSRNEGRTSLKLSSRKLFFVFFSSVSNLVLAFFLVLVCFVQRSFCIFFLFTLVFFWLSFNFF